MSTPQLTAVLLASQASDAVTIVLLSVVLLTLLAMLLATFFGYGIRGWPEPTRAGTAYLRAFLFVFGALLALVVARVLYLLVVCSSVPPKL